MRQLGACRFLNQVHREPGDSTSRTDAFAHAICQFDMMRLRGRDLSRLCYADDGLSDAAPRWSIRVEITFEIERSHAGVCRIVEPKLRNAASGWVLRFAVFTIRVLLRCTLFIQVRML
jgi:hypothetical protein